jgi:hypothetical protein
MTNSIKTKTLHEKEYIAELLKERIYATIALLAVLISINTEHVSSLSALYIICGTIVSLWAASIVATQMSRRLIFQGELNHPMETEQQIRRHAPILTSLALPTLLLVLATFNLITLKIAITISIISSVLLLIGWSVGSARALQANKVPIILLAAAELAIGLAIVGLKLAVGH